MKIRRMRFVLPARMRGTAEADARLLAKNAARALQDGRMSAGSLQISGAGRPAAVLARDLIRASTATRRKV